MIAARGRFGVLSGHPPGLAVLAGTELWERFSFYGMQYLLMLYLTSELLLPGHQENVPGLMALRSLLSGGAPMSDLAFAAQFYGLYSAAVYITPLIGSWLGDRKLGRTRMVMIGAILMSFGHLLMAYESMFLVAIVLLTLGSGAFKGNLATQVSDLYADDDPRRTRAFAVYLGALNVGALMAGLVCGTLGEKQGWHWGFTAAGIGMLIGLAVYVSGRRFLPVDALTQRDREHRLTGAEKRRVAWALVILLPYCIILGVCFQAYATTLVWAKDHVDHRIGGWEMPITWVTTFDGIMTIVGVAVAARCWRWLGQRGREPSDLAKLVIGCGLVVAAYLILAAVAARPGTGLIAFLLFFVVMDMGFAWIDPPVTSYCTRIVPPALRGRMVALTMLAASASFMMVGWLGRFMEPLGAVRFFLLHAAIAVGALALAMILRVVAPRIGAPS